MVEEPFISIQEASKILKHTPAYVYSLIKKGLVEVSFRQFEGKRGQKFVSLKDVETIAAEEKLRKEIRAKFKASLNEDIQHENQRV